jgi:hypothetical protein
MNDGIANAERRSNRRRLWRIGLGLVAMVIAGWMYVATHPLVFNESFFSHAHCISQVSLAFRQYASEHFGQFPSHTNGYGDALLLLLAEGYERSHALTGSGYDRFVFDRALTNRTDVLETECGRVYVQGLKETSNADIVVLFDKLPTPGGDHCHGFARLRAPLCREVAFVDGSHRTVREADWQEFSRKQVGLLVKEGFGKEQAEALYAEKGRRR